MKLYRHQEEGIAKMVANATGFANFCEMGCGKSAMAVIAALKLGVAKVLIVCPNTLKYNWKDEWDKWSGEKWNVVVLDGTSIKRKKMLSELDPAKAWVVITNYESLLTLGTEMIKLRPDIIIADEAHQMKNHRAKRTKALKKIPSRYKFALTGTPMPQSPLDIWSIYDWIRTGYLHPNFYAFRAIYADVYTGAGFPIIKFQEEKLAKLKEKVDKYCYRVTKDEALDLPEKVYQTIPIDLEPKAMQLYKQVAEELVADIGEHEVTADNILVKMVRLQQITSGFIKTDEDNILTVSSAKMDALKEIAENLPSEKLVVWTRFNYDVDMIKAELEKLGRRVFVMNGSVDTKTRAEQVKAFEEKNGANDAMVLNIKVGGVGITLVQARYVVYYSRNFSLGDEVQSQDRSHRIGQEHKVTYYNLMCNNTIDRYILKSIEKKHKLAAHVTGDDVRRMVMGEI